MVSSSRWLSPIEPIQTIDRLTSELVRAVQTGLLMPEQEISEQELSEQYAASSEVVDAALFRLAADGRIIRTGRGALVPPLDRAELHSIYRMRRLIEPSLAAAASRLLPAEQTDRLATLLAEHPRTTAGPDDLRRTRRLVHETLLRPAASDWEMRTIRQSLDTLERYLAIALARLGEDSEDIQSFDESHRRFVDACRSGSPRLAHADRLRHLELMEQVSGHALH